MTIVSNNYIRTCSYYYMAYSLLYKSISYIYHQFVVFGLFATVNYKNIKVCVSFINRIYTKVKFGQDSALPEFDGVCQDTLIFKLYLK